MSDSPKITKTEKSEKIKDPRKVEAGKRLAAISREAKERKAREKVVTAKTAKPDTQDSSTSIDYKYIIGGVGVVAAVGGLYFVYKRDRIEEASKVSVTASDVKPEKSERSEQPKRSERVYVVKHENAVKPASTKLDSFD